MKNAIIVMIVLAIALSANAEMFIGVNNVIDPPDVTIAPGETARIGIWADGNTPRGGFYLGIDVASSGMAEMNIDDAIIVYVGDTSGLYIYDDVEAAEFLGIQNPIIFIMLEDLYEPADPTEGLLVENIILRCTGVGEVILKLYDGNGEHIAQQVIHQVVPSPLTGLEITGPDEVPDNNTANFKAIAHYENGTSKDVTNLAQWSLDDDQIAQIGPGGLLKTNEVLALEEEIVISAGYQERGISVSAQKPVVVYADCTVAELIERNIDGALEIKEEIIAGLNDALERELRARRLLSEYAKDPSLTDLERREIMQARMNLQMAIYKEILSRMYIRDSIRRLEQVEKINNNNNPPVPGR